MKRANHLFIANFLGVLTIAAPAAIAQGVSFNDIDANGNGVLERAELESVFGANAQAALLKFDADGDGTVTLAEVREGNNAGGNDGDRGQSASAPGQTGETPARNGDDNPGRSGDDNPGQSGDDNPGRSGDDNPGRSGDDNPGRGDDNPGNGGDNPGRSNN